MYDADVRMLGGLAALCSILLLTDAGRIFYDRCEFKGFSCVKSTKVLGKFDITYTCSNSTGWDIELYLWQFRAPTSINSLKVANCSSLHLNLMCTTETRNIQSFHAFNITQLTIVPLPYGLALSAGQMIFEDISNMSSIPSRSFQQIKHMSSLAKHACSSPYRDLDSVVMKNIQMDSIEREAFHNLTQVKTFLFDNVTVPKVHTVAIQVFLAGQSEFLVVNSSFGVLEYLAIWVRGSKMVFQSNSVVELHSGAVNATVNQFVFSNNTIGWMHSAALSILAQNVKVMDSSFEYLATGAFQAIGPGMPENSLRNFGHLKFIYVFNNNLVESLEVRSLNPDFRAYNNVGSVLTVSYNAIKCTCSDIGWLGFSDGFGKQFSDLRVFHQLFLKEEHKNICLDAPCILPVRAVTFIVEKYHGKCHANVTVDTLCMDYYPTSTSAPPITKRITTKSVHNVTSPFFYQRFAKNSKATHFQRSDFMVLMIACPWVFSFYSLFGCV